MDLELLVSAEAAEATGNAGLTPRRQLARQELEGSPLLLPQPWDDATRELVHRRRWWTVPTAVTLAITAVVVIVLACLQGPMPRLRAWQASSFLESWDAAADKEPCLCIFDIDRTLTAEQGWSQKCVGALEMPDVMDTAYAGGPLVLSQLARTLAGTFCGRCYRGILAGGAASGAGSDMRDELVRVLGGIEGTLSNEWSSPHDVTSLLVAYADDNRKLETLHDMLDWLSLAQAVDVKPENVWVFDDRPENIKALEGSGFNGRQVSCSTRTGPVGLCGGRSQEVKKERGVHVCPPVAIKACLCLFDLDRTMLHAPHATKCDEDEGEAWAPHEHPGPPSHLGAPAGAAPFSDLARNLGRTFCHQCHRGIVSESQDRDVPPPLRKQLLAALGGLPSTLSDAWTHAGSVASPLVLGARTGHKKEVVKKIVDWFITRGVVLEDSSVHFFDDLAANIEEFNGTDYNARQVSCRSRDHAQGLCGGIAIETVHLPGVRLCPPPPKPSPVKNSTLEPCLCVFDIDRTLTTRQGSSSECENTQEAQDVTDTAYNQGTLTLSELALNINQTFCGKCYRGAVGAGDASGEGSRMREELLAALGGPVATLSTTWSTPQELDSLLVVGAADGTKQYTVHKMLEWLATIKLLDIKPQRVHFFDDKVSNVEAFKGTGFNAHVVSCFSRDGPKDAYGYCGGRLREVSSTPGVHTCPKEPPLDLCLCVFDIDRTLTGKQGAAQHCDGNLELPEVHGEDDRPGAAVLSELGHRVNETFCGNCYRAALSTGTVGGDGSPFRAQVLQAMGGVKATRSATWSAAGAVKSPLVVKAQEGQKLETVRSVVQWFAKQGLDIPDSRVHYFDDRAEDVRAFAGSGLNAQQLSCESREGLADRSSGLCGGRTAEVSKEAGVRLCPAGAPAPQLEPCLCVFDVDRTLTGKQDAADQCPGNLVVQGVLDEAYSKGTLVLSDLGQNLKKTFCRKCYRSIISVGHASGLHSKLRAVLLEQLGGVGVTLSDFWSQANAVSSALVFDATDGKKQSTVREVLAWFKDQGVTIEDNSVHFFDDRGSNVQSFNVTDFNAHQVSCDSRDHDIGLCGGLAAEVTEDLGLQLCGEPKREQRASESQGVNSTLLSNTSLLESTTLGPTTTTSSPTTSGPTTGAANDANSTNPPITDHQSPPLVPGPEPPAPPAVGLDAIGQSVSDGLGAEPEPCLCVFDIDRTLTGKQGAVEQCPGNLEMANISDQAYTKGTLVLSQLGQRLNETFCGRCFKGIVSAGIASGIDSPLRDVLLQVLGGEAATLTSTWSNPHPANSSLVVRALDGHKHETVRDIVRWFAARGVAVKDRHVHFFDDRNGNVPSFIGTGFNARQVSCGSRDGVIGLCGGLLEEVVDQPGVHVCPGLDQASGLPPTQKAKHAAQVAIST